MLVQAKWRGKTRKIIAVDLLLSLSTLLAGDLAKQRKGRRRIDDKTFVLSPYEVKRSKHS